MKPCMSSAIGVLVPIIQQACGRADVSTPAQMDAILGRYWRDILWAADKDSKTDAKKANIVWKNLHEYTKRYLTKYVLAPPRGERTQNDPPKLSLLVTLVFAMALCDSEWPLKDVLLERFAYEEEEGITPHTPGSSLRNLQAYSFLFGLGKRCLSDGRLNSLIDDHGVSKPVMNYCRELKPLHLVHDMISTFCNGKHVDSGSDDYLEKINKDLRVRLEIAQDGNDAVRNSTDELELAILQYKERQYEFATASKTWITDKGSRDAIHRCTYADIDPNPSGGGNGAAAGIFDQMDAAYHRVFKGVLNGVTSVSLAKAQGRLVRINPLYSNKTSFTTGVGEVPRVSVWAHPYTFDDITIYEFVTEGIKLTVGKDKKIKVDGMEAAIRRKLLVIFSLLGLLHAQHMAEKSVTVCDDFRAVVDHLKGEKSLAFQKLLVSDAPKHRISDNGPHFLSDMEREYIKGVIFLNVDDPVATPEDVAPVSGPAVAPPDINIDTRSVAVWSGDDNNAPTMIQVPLYICEALEQIMGGSEGMIHVNTKTSNTQRNPSTSSNSMQKGKGKNKALPPPNTDPGGGSEPVKYHSNRAMDNGEGGDAVDAWTTRLDTAREQGKGGGIYTSHVRSGSGRSVSGHVVGKRSGKGVRSSDPKRRKEGTRQKSPVSWKNKSSYAPPPQSRNREFSDENPVEDVGADCGNIDNNRNNTGGAGCGGTRRRRQETPGGGGLPDRDRGGDGNRDKKDCDGDPEEDGALVAINGTPKTCVVFSSDGGGDSRSNESVLSRRYDRS